MRRRSRFPVARLTALFVFASAVPLALLAYFSLTLAGDAVRTEIEQRVASNAAMTAAVLQEEMRALSEYVESYSRRPSLIEALDDRVRKPEDRRMLRLHLRDLRRTKAGVFTTFLASPDGTLVDIVPSTPSIVGENFAFRDWYRGVTRTGRPYISEAYRTRAAGSPLVVAAAVPIRANGRRLAILVAAYSLTHIQDEADVVRSENALFKITDQRGTLLAETGRPVTRLISRRTDERVQAALRGQAGVLELDTPDGRRLSAFAPVRSIGWTVTASVPADTAFAAISELRSTVVTIVAILGLVLLAGVLILVRALRSRRRAEEDAQRLASINQAVVEATPAGILLVDPEGNRLVENEALRRMTEASLQIPGETVYEEAERTADQFADPASFRWAMSEVASDQERETSIELDTHDGRSFHLYTGPVRESTDSMLGRIFVIRDQTAEREAERLKSELVATVSHELRTPLSSILGYAELLSERELDAPLRKTYVSTIYGEAKRLTKLINDFLDLQRIEAGGFSLSLEAFSLRDLLQEQVELFSAQSDRHTLELEEDDDPLPVLADRDRVAQVIGNLVSNAIKYSPDGGSVVVATEKAGNGLRVSVRDQGLGIPADQQRRLFTKFYRVDTSDTREIGGTGLGLALCREIVEAHGGRIGFESVEGEGSTFWFLLPAASARDESGPHRLLVVEDDPAAADLLGDYLADDGHAVEVVATGEQALVRAAQDPPAAICLDVVLGGELDGWKVLAQLKASPATSSIPVIICTGRNGRSNAAALGAANFLAKPFSQRELRDAISRVLPTRSGSVLVVDDEASVRRLVQESLRGNGYEVREAADGEEALGKISEQKPDAVILDLIMPGLDGFAVLERLQAAAETRFLPVIVLTAQRLSNEERDRLLLRSVALLEKSSYSAAELRRLVRRAVAQ